ncbi:MAG: MBOAT family protein [Bacteroidetes bacterium]|nr:MBOAT family protein [Bacteroidota bacterium]
MFTLKDIFVYSSKNPLLYTQYLFWFVFTFFMLGYSVLYKKNTMRKVYLIIFGVFFYYKSGGYFFFLLLISTVTDYYIGKAIYNAKTQMRKKLFVALAVFWNLGILCYFKYYYFFVDGINYLVDWLNHSAGFHWAHLKTFNYFADLSNITFGSHFDVLSVILPVGISFFTFQTISYSIDIYRGQIKPLNSIIDFCFFVTYFPQLLAGPIVRASVFVPQINKPYALTNDDFGKAIFLIMGGLFKKIIISDFISGNFVDRVFSNPMLYSGFENLMAVYGYTIQIYCDFSGYTDIAIGLALLMGFHLPKNFDSPYKATNITDFWRRWHISLSTWLRDYLYIPLGGNKKGKIRQYINLFLTMLLGGLWHGANIRFIIWGGVHGLGLAFHKLWMQFFPSTQKKKNNFILIISGLITFHFVAFCWIFFRAPNMAVVGQMMGQVFHHFNINLASDFITGYWRVMAMIILGYAIHLLPSSLKLSATNRFINLPLAAKAVAIALLVVIMYQGMSSAVQPFIYFQF